MVDFLAHFDGRNLLPDEPVDLPTDKPLRVTVEEAAGRGDAAPLDLAKFSGRSKRSAASSKARRTGPPSTTITLRGREGGTVEWRLSGCSWTRASCWPCSTRATITPGCREGVSAAERKWDLLVEQETGNSARTSRSAPRTVPPSEPRRWSQWSCSAEQGRRSLRCGSTHVDGPEELEHGQQRRGLVCLRDRIPERLVEWRSTDASGGRYMPSKWARETLP